MVEVWGEGVRHVKMFWSLVGWRRRMRKGVKGGKQKVKQEDGVVDWEEGDAVWEMQVGEEVTVDWHTRRAPRRAQGQPSSTPSWSGRSTSAHRRPRALAGPAIVSPAHCR